MNSGISDEAQVKDPEIDILMQCDGGECVLQVSEKIMFLTCL